MPKATVVIATRNRSQHLAACLEALVPQLEDANSEIVVADNGSSDDTKDVLSSFATRGVRSRYVAEANRAKARNAAIATARGEQIVFCDDDTIAPPQFLAAHLGAHAATPQAVVTGPIVNVAGPQHFIAPGARHFSRAFFCTCNASVAKSALEAAGGFDERYDLYGWEDTDLGIRLRARGLRRVFRWDAYIYHIKPPEQLTFEKRRALATEKAAMAARFLRKTPSWPVKLATGAYALNFLRSSLVAAAPLRRVYHRLLNDSPTSLLGAIARDALVDATYIDALKAALRDANG